MNIAIEGTPPLHKLLWCFLAANAPAVRQWDGFKVLITLQYPKIKPVEDILECFEEFQSHLEETCHNELSSVEALGDYLHIFQLWFLGMKTLPGKLEHEAHLSFHLRGIPLNFKSLMQAHGTLWPIQLKRQLRLMLATIL
ncbi:hypothetical protein PISMIDRAFT_17410 [Pisolithus microcarpus 441]|uniref:Uncharacterized protein n=1 Tax=Pisolithus microcarpus 441 TaxID=765257 RepID=A0A0C9XPF2_9AGAM|nr:hypothetical protein PISMIDRAFT_17410 [Pisolithus microcarpus 441]